MEQLREQIEKMGPEEIDGLLKMVLCRHTLLHPGWEICLISLEKDKDHDAQIDSIVCFLQKLKRMR